MELRTYWQIVWKRWWLVLIVAAAVAGLSTLLQPQTRDSYTSTVLLEAEPPSEPYRGGYAPNQDRYYGTLLMELLWDDVSRALKDQEFLAQVRQEAAPQLGGRSPSGSLDTKKEHQYNAVSATADSPEVAQALANTAAKLLIDPNGLFQRRYFTGRAVSVKIVAPAGAATVSSRIGGNVNLGLRVLLGLIAGIALAFLLEYLDDSVRSVREAEDLLGVPVLGEIPLAR